MMGFEHPFVNVFLQLLSELLHFLLFSFVVYINWVINVNIIHLNLICVKDGLFKILDHHSNFFIWSRKSSLLLGSCLTLLIWISDRFHSCIEFLVWKGTIFIYIKFIVCVDWLILGNESVFRMIRIILHIKI